MKAGVGLLVLFVTLAGCVAAPGTAPQSPTQTTTPTPVDTPTLSPTPSVTPTPSGPTHDGVGARITQVDVSERTATATVRFTNYGQDASRASLAFRFVENNTHALVGETSLDPGASETIEAPLTLYSDEPENLTVQVRVNGTIVAEREVLPR